MEAILVLVKNIYKWSAEKAFYQFFHKKLTVNKSTGLKIIKNFFNFFRDLIR